MLGEAAISAPAPYTGRAMLRSAFLVLFFALPASAEQTRPAPSVDEQAVREVVRQYVNARELKDPKAIGALFTEDADQHTTGAEWRRGRAQIVPGTLESSTRNPGPRRITVDAVRFMTPDVAIVDGPYEIGTRRMWTTIVLQRDAGIWRIAAIRNMVPAGGQAQGR
jgi:uncharacterized protein (TIGR02246 family)